MKGDNKVIISALIKAVCHSCFNPPGSAFTQLRYIMGALQCGLRLNT